MIAGSFVAFGFCAAFVFGSEGGVGPLAWGVLLLFVAVFAAGIYAEARRDFYGFCSSMSLFGLVVAATAAFVVVVWPPARPVAASLGFAAVLVAVVCLARTSIARKRDRNPNFLREKFVDSGIRERDGVQFVLVPPNETVKAGDAFEVQILAQNCMDAPRRLQIALKPLRTASIRPGRFRFDEQAAVLLPPRAAGRLTIPVIVGSEAKGLQIWKSVPTVTGRPGRRVLLWSPRKDLGGLVAETATAIGLLGRRDEPRFQVRVVVRDTANAPGSEPSEAMPSRSEVLGHESVS